MDEYYADVYIDQFALYLFAVTPDGDAPAAFSEEVPLDTAAPGAWVGVLKDLNSKYYTEASWSAIQSALAKIDLNKADLLQSEVTVWATERKTAIRAREYVGTDKLYIDEERVLVNYSVPLGSVSGTQKRSARPIYGKLFNITTGNWDEYSAVSVFDVVNGGQTNTDMGNPASVLLDDGRIFTVGYSNPSNASSIIVGQYTTVDYYEGGSTSSEGGSLKTENLVTESFDSASC